MGVFLNREQANGVASAASLFMHETRGNHRPMCGGCRATDRIDQEQERRCMQCNHTFRARIGVSGRARGVKGNLSLQFYWGVWGASTTQQSAPTCRVATALVCPPWLHYIGELQSAPTCRVPQKKMHSGDSHHHLVCYSCCKMANLAVVGFIRATEIGDEWRFMFPRLTFARGKGCIDILKLKVLWLAIARCRLAWNA